MYRDYVIMCMLTIGDDELTVGDNDDVLLEAARDGHMRECPENSYGWASRVQFTSTCLFFFRDHRKTNLT